MRFKTQAEIYKHLLDGGAVYRPSYQPTRGHIYCILKDGLLVDSYGNLTMISFGEPADWEPYTESKPKVTYLEYIATPDQKSNIDVFGYCFWKKDSDVTFNVNWIYTPTGRKIEVEE